MLEAYRSPLISILLVDHLLRQWHFHAAADLYSDGPSITNENVFKRLGLNIIARYYSKQFYSLWAIKI